MKQKTKTNQRRLEKSQRLFFRNTKGLSTFIPQALYNASKKVEKFTFFCVVA
jgi:tRNA A37 N6-isopentenylltransferase MiaA